MNDSCRLDLEDREHLRKLQQLPRAFRSFSRPKEVGVDWHKTENQGRLGSCEGNANSSCSERALFAATGLEVQLSRIFAYLATQKMDGLLGSDQGATVSNGSKLSLENGLCLEERTGYPSAYPDAAARAAILSPANYAAGRIYRVGSLWAVPEDPDEACNFIGGGGAINFGIPWWPGFMPADRVVRSYRPPSRAGGHAMAVLGYTAAGNLRAVNSHGDGPYEITPDAWRSMMRHPWSAAVGLVGTAEPVPVDWVKNSYIRSGMYQ